MAVEQQTFGIEEIAREVSLRAAGRPIGELQKRRSERRGLSMVPSLFDRRTIKERYAFHVGGLAELQFNIGFEKSAQGDVFRHGVAFSLQPTHAQPDIRVLVPRIERFNEFMRTYPEEFAGLRMWHFIKGEREGPYAPGVIPEELVRPHAFVMLGARQPADAIDIDLVLEDFDRLMPLYDYVEGADPFPRLTPHRKGFAWTPGNKVRVAHARFSRQEQIVDKALRHNILQDALFRHLAARHGADNVSGEQDCGNGTPVDVAVRDGDGYIYYEIKTGLSAQSSIRQALGQLMEYSYWPGAQEAGKLVIVGEEALDAEGKAYLAMLNKRFGLPVSYNRFDLKRRKLVS